MEGKFTECNVVTWNRDNDGTIQNLVACFKFRWSNVGNEGIWMYKLGPLDQLEMIQSVPPKVLERPSLKGIKTKSNSFEY